MEGKKEDLPVHEQLRLKNIEENRNKMLELAVILQKVNVNEDEVKPLQERNINRQKKRKYNKLKLAKPMKKKPTRQSLRLNQFIERMTSTQMLDFILGQVCAGNMIKTKNYEVQVLPEVDDSADEGACIVSASENSDSSDEESDEQSSNKRKKRESSFGPQKRVRAESTTGPREVLPPEKITEEMPKNIAEFATGKTYSQTDATTCYQCRQKTTDQKSICRSKQCFGDRGQYCDPCLKNCYGESVKDALMNPDWNCPVCRTGQLAPFELGNGFNSVHDNLVKEKPHDTHDD